MTFFSVVKRMAKGAVEPLLWVVAFFAAVVGTTALVANYTGSTPEELFMFVWLGYAVAVGLYWAYGYTKMMMQFEQNRIERELKRNS